MSFGYASQFPYQKSHVGLSDMTFFSLNPLSFALLMTSPFQGEFRPCPGRSSCCCQHDSYLSNHRHCLRCGASVREAHLRALVWASLRLCSLFDCFSAAKPMSTPPDALRGGPDLIYGSYLAAKPMCAPPDALRPIVLSTVSQHLQPFPEPSPSPVERESPSCRVSARSTVTELTPLSGKVRLAVPPFAQRNPAFWWTTLPVHHTCPPQHPFWWTNTHSYLPSSPRSASQSPDVRFAATKAGFGAVFLQRRLCGRLLVRFAV